MLEAGTSTSESSANGAEIAAATGSTAGTDHTALTVVVDATTSPTVDSDSDSTVASSSESDSDSSTSTSASAPATGDSNDDRDDIATTTTSGTAAASAAPARFVTLRPGASLPTGDQCASWVRAAGATTEHRSDNAPANGTIPPASVIDGLVIDGADAARNRQLAPRIDGDFTGTTEQILQWGACKWGFDEDVTRARAVAESSWRMSTTGDRTGDAELCNRIGLSAPCPQSYGLLQVKGTVHEGTYPASAQATAFGVDYAMAWLRACFEGGFGWIDGSGDGRGYAAGDDWGCVGAWFSGRWWDQSANDYVGRVRQHLEQRTWESYR